MVPAETVGRAGKIEGERARSRYVKIGCAFTQTTVDNEGLPIRHEASTTYTGAIEIAEEFGRRMYTEAWHRDWERAKKKAVLGDGANWIWNIAAQPFPGASQIVDLYHAREPVWQLAAKLFPVDPKQRRRWAGKLQKKLDGGKIRTLVAELRALSPPSPELGDLLRNHRQPIQTIRHVLDSSRRHPQSLLSAVIASAESSSTTGFADIRRLNLDNNVAHLLIDLSRRWWIESDLCERGGRNEIVSGVVCGTDIGLGSQCAIGWLCFAHSE